MVPFIITRFHIAKTLLCRVAKCIIKATGCCVRKWVSGIIHISWRIIQAPRARFFLKYWMLVNHDVFIKPYENKNKNKDGCNDRNDIHPHYMKKYVNKISWKYSNESRKKYFHNMLVHCFFRRLFTSYIILHKFILNFTPPFYHCFKYRKQFNV